MGGELDDPHAARRAASAGRSHARIVDDHCARSGWDNNYDYNISCVFRDQRCNIIVILNSSIDEKCINGLAFFLCHDDSVVDLSVLYSASN